MHSKQVFRTHVCHAGTAAWDFLLSTTHGAGIKVLKSYYEALSPGNSLLPDPSSGKGCPEHKDNEGTERQNLHATIIGVFIQLISSTNIY